MKLEVVDSKKLFEGTIKTEFFKVEGQNIAYLWSLFQLYKSKRAAENYTQVAFQNLIDEGRFSYGAAVTTLDNDPICFCGLHLYDNWAIITRLVILKFFTAPIVSGHMLPFLIEKAKADNLDGLVATVNPYNIKMLNDLMCTERPERYNTLNMHKNNKTHKIYQEALNTGRMFQKLEYTVNYRFTEQHVAFVPLKNTQPQFEPFKNIQL